MRKALSLLLVGTLLFSCILLPATATQSTVATTPAAVSSVSAAEPGVAPDGTVADDAKNLSLIITEYMADTKSPEVGPIQGGDTTTVHYNGFQYIEIYNSGDVAVDLYKVAIAVTSDEQDYNGNRYWSDLHQFQKKMSLRAGSIYTGVRFTAEQAPYSSVKAENPDTAVLEPDETAVIWFWNNYTYNVASRMSKSPGEAVDGVYHKGFKEFYGMNDDALVLAVYAGTDADGGQSANPSSYCSRFILNTTGSWYTYALIDEMGMGPNGWDVDTPAWTKDEGYNERVLTLFGWGTGTHHGLYAAEDYATVYVPANVAPDIYNKYQTNLGLGSFTPASDYVGSEYAASYKEMAVTHGGQAPTPGVIPAWQLAYIAASKGETLDAAAQTAINHFLAATAPGLADVPDRAETKIEVQLRPSEE